MPASPVISFTDLANGGDCSITITGSDSGASNQVKYQAVGAAAWSNFGSPLVDDGTVNGTLTPGYYQFHCVSSLGGSDAVSNVLLFQAVTHSDTAIHELILQGVEAIVKAMAGTSLEDLTAGRVYRRDEFDLGKQDTWNIDLPAVVITQSTSVQTIPYSNLREKFGYGVDIFCLTPKSPADREHTPRHLMWLERIRRRFTRQWILTIPNCSEVNVEQPVTITHADGTLGVGYQKLTVISAETRGI